MKFVFLAIISTRLEAMDGPGAFASDPKTAHLTAANHLTLTWPFSPLTKRGAAITVDIGRAASGAFFLAL